MAKLAESRRARRALDARLGGLQASAFTVPNADYIRAIRDALQMSAAELAARLGVSQPAVIALETNEKKGSIRLESLRRAAEAMDCELVYAFIAKKGLEQTLRDRAKEVAASELKGVAHSMALEGQASSVDESLLEEAITRLTASRGLWSKR